MNNTEQIRQLLAKFSYYADTKQAEQQAGLFAENGVLNVFTPDNHEVPFQNITTKEEMIATFNGLKTFTTVFHHMGQSMIELIDETHATAITYVMAYLENEEGMMQQAIRYHDELVVENGEWKLQTRGLYLQFIK